MFQTLDFSRNNLEKVFFQRDKRQKETAATSQIAAVPFLKREKRERKESVYGKSEVNGFPATDRS